MKTPAQERTDAGAGGGPLRQTEQIRKPIKNDDLYDACREAFANGWQKVKLYFLCGLPGARTVDLDGIVDMAQRIALISKEAKRPLQGGDGVGVELRTEAAHAVSVERDADARVPTLGRRIHAASPNYVLRENQAARCGMQLARSVRTCAATGAFRRRWKRRGDRGARMDGWRECFQPELWGRGIADLGIDTAFYSQCARPTDERLPWDHVNVKKGREYLEKEQNRSLLQLQVMAERVRRETHPAPDYCGQETIYARDRTKANALDARAVYSDVGHGVLYRTPCGTH